MKLRPVLLVIVLLSGFYYVTTHVASTGALAPWLHRTLVPATEPGGATTTLKRAAEAGFDLTEANAAPAFDTEELQNIAV